MKQPIIPWISDYLDLQFSTIPPALQLTIHPPEMPSKKKYPKAIAKAASESQEGFAKWLDTLSLFGDLAYTRKAARKVAREEARTGVKKQFPLETDNTYDLLREEATRNPGHDSRLLREVLWEVRTFSVAHLVSMVS
jgi:hypothetical protein